MWFNTINGYYQEGLYNEANLRTFVEAKMITTEEFTKITGKEYEQVQTA